MKTYRVEDMHTAGEPVRIIKADEFQPSGLTVLEHRRMLRDEKDHIRKALMLEPRGHADMYGAVIIENPVEDVDLGTVFIHNSGYSTMCGHATIALGRWLFDRDIQNGASLKDKSYRIECPCGPVEVDVTTSDGGKVSTAFDSVPCFAEAIEETSDIPGIGIVTYDIGYGGAYYAILPSSEIGMDFYETPVADLHSAAIKITDHLRKTRPISHPEVDDLSFLYGTIFTDGNTDFSDNAFSANLCVFAEGQIDRSPTGSGVSARLALEYAKGNVAIDQIVSFAGYTGMPFDGKIVKAQDNNVIVRVSGESYYTGTSEFVVEEKDPLANGFSNPNTMKDVIKS